MHRYSISEKDADRIGMVDDYKAGATIRQLMEKYNRSHGYTHRILTDAGVVFRPRGRRPK